MHFIILILLVTIGLGQCSQFRTLRQAPTTSSPISSNSETDFYEEEPCQDEDSIDPVAVERGQMAAEYFPEPISRERTKLILRRALELLEKPKKRARLSCQGENIDTEARNALRFLTGEGVGSTTEESNSATGSQATQSSSDYCEPQFVIPGTNRRPTLQTLSNIIKLHDEGHSEKSIQGEYRWYKRQYLEDMRRQVQAGGTREQRLKRIDESTFQRVNESVNANLPIH